MSFVCGKEQVGYASLEKLDGLAVGTVLKVRLKDDWKKEGAQHFLTCEISHEPFESDFYCQTEGKLWMNDTRTYASVRTKVDRFTCRFRWWKVTRGEITCMWRQPYALMRRRIIGIGRH